jgi:hypothetical protein
VKAPTTDKLAYMANQIGKSLAQQLHDKPVAAIADHIQKFCGPRIRIEILAHLQAVKLDPAAR